MKLWALVPPNICTACCFKMSSKFLALKSALGARKDIRNET